MRKAAQIWENFPLAIEQDMDYELRIVEGEEVHYARMRMRTGVCIRLVHEGVPCDNIIPNVLGLDSGEMKEQILSFNHMRPNAPLELKQMRALV